MNHPHIKMSLTTLTTLTTYCEPRTIRCSTDVNKLVNISLFRIINIKNVRIVTFFIGKMCDFAIKS